MTTDTGSYPATDTEHLVCLTDKQVKKFAVEVETQSFQDVLSLP